MVNPDMEGAALKAVGSFDVRPGVMPLDDNLIGVVVTERPVGVTKPVQIEKLELHMVYRSS